jgi:hypothetical protein
MAYSYLLPILAPPHFEVSGYFGAQTSLSDATAK